MLLEVAAANVPNNIAVPACAGAGNIVDVTAIGWTAIMKLIPGMEYSDQVLGII